MCHTFTNNQINQRSVGINALHFSSLFIGGGPEDPVHRQNLRLSLLCIRPRSHTTEKTAEEDYRNRHGSSTHYYIASNVMKLTNKAYGTIKLGKSRTILYSFVLSDCWLVVSMNPQFPDTGHLSTSFLGFTLSLSKCWDGPQDPSCYYLLLMQPSQFSFIKIYVLTVEVTKLIT